MDRRALLLSRLQLAFTVSFHILPEKDVRFIVIEQLCLIRPLSLTPAGRGLSRTSSTASARRQSYCPPPSEIQSCSSA